MTTQTVLATAKSLTFIREVPFGTNAGRWVEALQRIAGGTKGDAWCAAFVSAVLGIAFRDHPPLPYTMSCDELLKGARRWGWDSEAPQVGDVFLVMKSKDDAIHTGFVASVQGALFRTIEGNASDPEKPATREGWGVYERARQNTPGKYVFIHYTRKAS